MPYCNSCGHNRASRLSILLFAALLSACNSSSNSDDTQNNDSNTDGNTDNSPDTTTDTPATPANSSRMAAMLYDLDGNGQTDAKTTFSYNSSGYLTGAKHILIDDGQADNLPNAVRGISGFFTFDYALDYRGPINLTLNYDDQNRLVRALLEAPEDEKSRVEDTYSWNSSNQITRYISDLYSTNGGLWRRIDANLNYKAGLITGWEMLSSLYKYNQSFNYTGSITYNSDGLPTIYQYSLADGSDLQTQGFNWTDGRLSSFTSNDGVSIFTFSYTYSSDGKILTEVMENSSYGTHTHHVTYDSTDKASSIRILINNAAASAEVTATPEWETGACVETRFWGLDAANATQGAGSKPYSAGTGYATLNTCADFGQAK